MTLLSGVSMDLPQVWTGGTRTNGTDNALTTSGVPDALNGSK